MYVGDWKNDMQNGHGKLVKKAGDVFEGNFKGTASVDGEVIIHYANGLKFKGVFKNGKPNGPAIGRDQGR